MKTTNLPEALLEKQRQAGRARQAALTPEQRIALGKLAWAKRLARYQRMAAAMQSSIGAGRGLPH